jgi:hypothetical protein
VNNETGAFIFHDGWPALQNKEVYTSQVKSVGGCESYGTATNNYDLEKVVHVAHFDSFPFLFFMLR